MRNEAKVFIRMFCTVLLMLSGGGMARADIHRGDESYGKELTSVLEKKVGAIRSAKGPQEKQAALKALRAWLESEKKKARAALEKAEASKSTELERADARDSEILRLYYSFEPVFRDLLARRGSGASAKREKSCRELPREIRFNELAARPDGTPLSRYGEQAIAVVEELCK